MKPDGMIKYAALIPEPHAARGFWLLDLGSNQIDKQGLASLSQVDLLVCLDAKEFLTQTDISLKPDLKILCLSTVKKLLAKDHNSPLEVPELANADEALAWVTNALEKAFLEIERRHIGVEVAPANTVHAKNFRDIDVIFLRQPVYEIAVEFRMRTVSVQKYYGFVLGFAGLFEFHFSRISLMSLKSSFRKSGV